MDFTIDEKSGSAVSKFSFGFMVCSVVSYIISLAAHNGATTKGAWVLMIASSMGALTK